MSANQIFHFYIAGNVLELACWNTTNNVLKSRPTTSTNSDTVVYIYVMGGDLRERVL